MVDSSELDFKIIGKTIHLPDNTKVMYCLASPKTYLQIIGDDFENFEFQRNRQNHKGYKQLKEDIRNGGVIPAITLSVKSNKIDEIIELDNDEGAFIDRISQGDCLDILDGLQRTYIINDLNHEGVSFNKEQRFLLEIWLEKDINNIMKRMIILNSSQKRMSSKHQVDLLFSTFFNEKIKTDLPENIVVYREKDKKLPDFKIDAYSYPLNRIASSYYSYLKAKAVISNDELINNLFLDEDEAGDVEKNIIGSKYLAFQKHFAVFVKINQHLWKIYEDNKSHQEWFASDIVMSAVFASLAKIDQKNNNHNSEFLNNLFIFLTENSNEDPLSLNHFDDIKTKKKSNIGVFQRKLVEKFIFNLILEFKNSHTDIKLKDIWDEALEAVL